MWLTNDNTKHLNSAIHKMHWIEYHFPMHVHSHALPRSSFMKGYFKMRCLATCSICDLLGWVLYFTFRRVVKVRHMSCLLSPSNDLELILVWLSSRQLSGMLISLGAVLVTDRSEPLLLFLPSSDKWIDAVSGAEQVDWECIRSYREWEWRCTKTSGDRIIWRPTTFLQN